MDLKSFNVLGRRQRGTAADFLETSSVSRNKHPNATLAAPQKMLPQRPAGAPPPRPGRPPGSPPGSPLGKPPGPPPGPPPGSPGQAAVAKPPPRGPPPATASSSAVPSKPPPSAPPPRAEAKAPAPTPAAPAKKAPPPPRVGAPASQPPPEDEKKGSTSPAGRSSPQPPPGKPQRGPSRATPPGGPSPAGSPASTAGASPPRGPPPGRPPPGSPAPAGAGPPRGPPPRGPPPRGPPPRGPPPRGPLPRGLPPGKPAVPPPGKPPGMPPGAPPGPSPGAPQGAPPGKAPPSAEASSTTLQQQRQESQEQGQEQSTAVGPSSAGGENAAMEQAYVAGMEAGGEAGKDETDAPAAGRARGAASPPAVKRLKTPPPSPKAPPGVPAGMVPPQTQPPGAGKQSAAAMDVETTGNAGDEQRDGEGKKDSPPASPSTTLAKARVAPPGRRPPPGAPPGRAPPSIAPPSARPAPPSVEDVALLTSKEEEQIVIADDKEAEEDVPPPPEGLPPPDGLSDDDDDDDDDASKGQIVGIDDDGVESARVGELAAKDLEVLRRGRFIVRCIEGGDVKKSALSNKTPTVDAYLRITLGKHKRAPSKKTKVVKRSGLSPDFESERLIFDIVEPREFVVAGDVALSIEIWDDSAWSDDLLASVNLSALRFMHPDAIPAEEWFPLEAPSGRLKDRMKVLVEISFEPALLGMFVLTLFEGRGLGDNDPASRPNPYVVASLGEMYQKRSRAAKGGGSAPVFRQEEIVLWIDKENWTNDLQLQIRSEDIGTDSELGSAKISVLPAMGISPDQATEKKIELFLDGQPAGQLFAKCTFLPAGKLSFVCEGGRGLRETSAAGRMDPYVIFKADGQAVSLTRKTKVDKDGGTDPRWNETVEIDIVDQYTLWLECFNHDVLDSDELIGSAQCSLLPVFKRGTLDTWVQLTSSSGPGPPKPAGEIHCILSFEGPLGVAYPQHQPGVDSFDDSLRVNLKGYLEEAKEKDKGAGQPEEANASTAVVGHQDRPALQRRDEFTDEEIASAFKFLDLDHNLHIGAAEIRHILICMGELITDEEVDMMISMVDSDGDGQVSYEEFHRMVIDPDPSRADFSTEPIKTDAQEAAQVSQEMKDRESKRWLLEEFVKENEIRAVELEMAYKRFKNLAPSSGSGGKQAASSVEMDFNTWILVFNVEATGQYRKLFKLYALPGTGDGEDTETHSQKVDIREFFLGMANFVEWSLEPRTQFIFTLFDDDRSGFLSMDELVAVLKANHLATAKAVAKKAQTIMRQADADGSGTLTLDEFLVVAKKFPNLLFPAKPKPTEEKEKVPMLGNG